MPGNGKRGAGLLLMQALAAVVLTGCAENPPEDKLLAARTESALELVGGPAAQGRVGDFVLQNDRIKLLIGGPEHSWSFGLFGGSLLDADLVRTEAGLRNGKGKDCFAELFPTVNLVTPDPIPDGVEVLDSGEDGTAASVRVFGRGTMMFDILKIITNDLLSLLFKELKTRYYFETVYEVKPGQKYVEIRTSALREVAADAYCDTLPGASEGGFACDKDCTQGGTLKRNAYALKRVVEDNGVEHWCPQCECAEPEELPTFTGTQPMLKYIAGDIHPVSPTLGELLKQFLKLETTGVTSGGLVAGDFMFFGPKTDIFLPGLGFDESTRVFDDLYEGRDSLSNPLEFPWAAAAGTDVSYLYFTADPAGGGKPSKVLIPLITSSATVVIGSGRSCIQDSSDDAACDDVRLWTFRRYLAVGKGDIGSAVDVFYEFKNGIDEATGLVKGVGRIEGSVLARETLAPVSHADVFLVAVPDPKLGCEWETYDELKACNVLATQVDAAGDGAVDLPGSPGILNQWQTDVGTDKVKDGRFGGYVEPGSYVVMARTESSWLSPLYPVTVEAGETQTLVLTLSPTARVKYRVEDETGQLLPAKIVFIALDDEARPMYRDGLRRVELGDGRLQHGIRKIVLTESGQGTVEMEPGAYQVLVSRGLEYSLFDIPRLDLEAGKDAIVQAQIRREVDTSGWIAGDFHLHAAPSMDAGLPVSNRIVALAAEGVEYAASSDHDIVTDYEPWIRVLGLQKWLKTVPGTEVSTLELGHFNAFPVEHDPALVPDHGALDWVTQDSSAEADVTPSQVCIPPGDLFAAMRAMKGDGMPNPLVQLNHPADGVMGYFAQMGLDQFSMDRRSRLFGMDISGLGATLDQYWGLVSMFAQSDPILKDFLDKRNITKETLADQIAGLLNPSMSKVSCDLDTVELINSKSFQYTRVPTVREVNDYNRCLAAIKAVPVPVDPFDEATKGLVLEVCEDLKLPRPECEAEDLDPDLAQECLWSGDLADEIEGFCKRESVSVHDCKEFARLAFSKFSIRRMLQRRVAEQNERYMDLDQDPGTSELCSVAHAQAGDVPPENLDDPCSDRYGVVDLWFRLINHGFYMAGLASSDSHDILFEAGFPRTLVRSSTDRPDVTDVAELTRNIEDGKMLSTSGPFVTVGIGDAGPGETTTVSGDSAVLDIRIQTPSWFGVDRVEIYRNGRLEKVLYTQDVGGADGVLSGDPADIVDFEGSVEMETQGEDSWFVVVASGLNDENLLAPVYTTPPFGALLLAEIMTMAFGVLLPEGIAFPTQSLIPDDFPVVPYAITNPIFVDVDGGGYAPPQGGPLFCERPCKPEYDAAGRPTKSDCPAESKNLVCLEDAGSATGGLCGVYIPGHCVYEAVETQMAPLALPGETHVDSNALTLPAVRRQSPDLPGVQMRSVSLLVRKLMFD